MKGRIVATETHIKMKPGQAVFWFLAVIGALMLLGGVYFLGSIYPLDHILLSFGIIFTSGSVYFFLNSRYHKVTINEDSKAITILDSSIHSINPVRIPFDYFHWVALQRKSSGDSAGAFEVHLMNSCGSSLFLAEFPDNKKAIDFARNLQNRLGIDLLMEDEAISRLLQPRKSGLERKELVSREETGFTINDRGQEIELTWKNRQGIIPFIFFAAILYGFFHIIFFVIAPTGDIGALRYLLYAVTGLISLLLIYTFFINLLGKSSLSIGRRGIAWHISLLGKWIGRKEMERGNVAVVRNSLNLDDDTITIIGRHGLEAMSRLARAMGKIEKGKKPGFSLLSDVMTLKNDTITIDASALTFADRLFIEQTILRIM